MSDRRWVLRAAIALLCLPLLLAATAAVRFHVVNHENRSLLSAGGRRHYVLYVPKSYDPAKPAPLVISMHGAGLWGAAQRAISQWDRVADREGIIVAYPSGSTESGMRVWGVERGTAPARDVAFIGALIDTLEAEYNIDRDRIYANGLSNGGGMTFVLSCTMRDRIAAFGLVAAAMTLPWQWCADTLPAPMIWFQGTADPAIPYTGGTSWVSPGERRFPGVPGFTANWARRNGCASEPVDAAVAPTVTRREYVRCRGDASVVLYTIAGGGHTWPGGGSLPRPWLGVTSTAVDASSLMWEFYRAHPLRH